MTGNERVEAMKRQWEDPMSRKFQVRRELIFVGSSGQSAAIVGSIVCLITIDSTPFFYVRMWSLCNIDNRRRLIAKEDLLRPLRTRTVTMKILNSRALMCRH